MSNFKGIEAAHRKRSGVKPTDLEVKAFKFGTERSREAFIPIFTARLRRAVLVSYALGVSTGCAIMYYFG